MPPSGVLEMAWNGLLCDGVRANLTQMDLGAPLLSGMASLYFIMVNDMNMVYEARYFHSLLGKYYVCWPNSSVVVTNFNAAMVLTYFWRRMTWMLLENNDMDAFGEG